MGTKGAIKRHRECQSFSMSPKTMNLTLISAFYMSALLNPTFRIASDALNPTSVAIPYHTRSVALSLTDTQFLIPITFIPLKLGGSPFALTFLGI